MAKKKKKKKKHRLKLFSVYCYMSTQAHFPSMLVHAYSDDHALKMVTDEFGPGASPIIAVEYIRKAGIFGEDGSFSSKKGAYYKRTIKDSTKYE